MARTVRETKLETRTSRLRLASRAEPYWRGIHEGAHLGYYRGARAGKWVARFRAAGTATKGYVKVTLGQADDVADADGTRFLSFRQAQDRARAWFEEVVSGAHKRSDFTVAAQGRSGLGLEAQRQAVARFCLGRSCEVLGEYVEVESGKHSDRPELTSALHHAKVTGATLVVAKMDRLSRNAAFLLTLRESGAKLIAADNPDVNDMTIGILAVIAEEERKAISVRTMEALRAAKARGVRLGNPKGAQALRRAAKGNQAALAAIKEQADRHAADLAPIIQHLRSEGHHSLRQLASAMNDRRMACHFRKEPLRTGDSDYLMNQAVI